MFKKILIIVMCLILGLTGCGKDTNEVPEIESEGEEGVEEAIVDGETELETDVENELSQDNPFILFATKSDVAGINTDTSFKLYTEEKLDIATIERNINITPKQTLKVEKVSDREYNVIPLSGLEADAVYKVELKSTETEKTFSWAFQTKKEFKIKSTLPGNQSNYVPENSGIEIYFTHKNLDDISSYFEIEPKAEGRFIYKTNSAIFVPEKLEKNTKYTVKISKGYGIKDSDLALQEDYAFSFTTRGEENNYYFESTDKLYNFTENQAPVITVNMSNNLEDTEFDINVYSFNKAEDLLAELIKSDNKGSTSALYKDEIPESTNLKYTLKQSPAKIDIDYMQFHIFEMPENLEKGYYLVEYISENIKYYHYMQINNLLVYNGAFETEQITWVLDGTTGEPVEGATVQIEESDILVTNSDGTVVTPYKKDTKDFASYFTVEASDYETFIGRSTKKGFIPYEYYYVSPTGDVSLDYWYYLYTDRSRYLPDDTVKMWGYINPKSGLTEDKVTIEFRTHDYVFETKEISLTNIGTFEEEISYTGFTPGWYQIYVYYGENLVIKKEFYIKEYTKPIYKLSGEFDKEYISNGETIKYKVNCSFIDGTPVAGMELGFNYYVDGGKSGNIICNENGDGEVDITPTVDRTSWRPMSVQLESFNKNAEDQEVRNVSRFTLLPKDKMLEIEISGDKENPYAEILLHELDADKYSTEPGFKYLDMRGTPLNRQINIKVIETYYEKVLNREYYDHINKVNIKEYNYIRHEREIENINVNTVNGKYNLDCSYMANSNSDFKITVTYSENGDTIIEEKHFFYHIREELESQIKRYYINLDNNQDYKLNEEVKFSLYCNNGKVNDTDDNKLLIIAMQNGLLDYKVSNDIEGSFNFIESYIPNVLLKGVYLTDGKLYITEHDTYVNYDYTEREIDFTIEADKLDYKPGDEVVVNIETKDKNGNPLSADINISVVDEAYFQLYNHSANPLQSIYKRTGISGLIYEFSSHQEPGDMRNMAEKGGDGGGYMVRSDFKDTASFLSTKTDENGKANIKFKLPDNLTSWRITYQGVTDDMYAGSGKININTKLPFFINTIMGNTYITGDQPYISVRTFGDEVNKGEEITYKVVLNNGDNSEETIIQKGLAGDYTNIPLGKLEKGQYTITVYGESENYKDAIEETFDVVDSTVYFKNKWYYSITEDIEFKKVYSLATLTFFNESKSNYYKCLSELGRSGKRIDQLLGYKFSRKFIKENFDEDIYYDDTVNYKQYQLHDGGIGLLTYSESDPEISAKICSLTHDEFENNLLMNYFENILQNENSDITSVTAAYWGLSTFNKPVLLDVYEILNTMELELKEKLYLALALAEFGDFKEAKKIFDEVKNLKFYEDSTDNLEATALTAVLAVKIGEFEDGDKLFKYLVENPSDFILTNIEKLIYIYNRDIMNTNEVKALFGEVTIDINGEKTVLELERFKTESITVSPEELENIKIENIKSSIGCYVEALGSKNDLEENKTDKYIITKKYYVNDKETHTFEQSDLIKVIIEPKLFTDEKGYFIITDFIPAGFRYVSRNGKGISWPRERSGQKIEFSYSEYKNEPIVYYIQAVQPGTYTGDHTIIRKYTGTELNYTEKDLLTIE